MGMNTLLIQLLLFGAVFGGLFLLQRLTRKGLDDLEQKTSNNAEGLWRLKRQSWRSINSLRADIDQLTNSTGGLWRTAKGEVLQIRQMSDSHIENAIAYIDEHDPEMVGSRQLMLKEQKRRRYDLKMRKPIYVDIPVREFQERGGKVMATESCPQPDDKTAKQAVKPLEAPECKIMPPAKVFGELRPGDQFCSVSGRLYTCIKPAEGFNAIESGTGIRGFFPSHYPVSKKALEHKINWVKVDKVLRDGSRGLGDYQTASEILAKLLGRKV